jgi:hypothetical protein
MAGETNTASELLFESFLASCGISFEPIPRSQVPSSKSPDYRLELGGHTIIVEVKQIDPSPADEAHLLEFVRDGETHVISDEPGRRVRNKLRSAVDQLREHARGKFPAMVVIYDNVRLLGETEPYDVLTGMYGLEQVHIAVPADPHVRPYIYRHRFGKKSVLSRFDNTTISCVAILREAHSTQVTMSVFHNCYAAIPLVPDLLRFPRIRHFRLDFPPDESPDPHWVEV